MRFVLGALVACALLVASAHADPLLDALETDDTTALATAVGAIEHAADASPDTLFAAGRACEDRLHDPGRALGLYERISRDMPDARVAIAASRRATQLRGEVGEHGEHADRAKQLAELMANADALTPSQVLSSAQQLADAAWPGAPDAALFRADFLRRTKSLAAAQLGYADIVKRWPSSPQAIVAMRGQAGTAIDANEWALAVKLTNALPILDPADVVLRDDLLASIRSGRFRARIYALAWVFLVGGLAALLTSLVEASVRARARPALRPPVEVLFLAPFGGILVAIAYAQRMPVAPSVAVLTAGTLGMAWVSGATLDLVRRAHPVRLRAIAHTVACALAALALFYISLVRAGLLDVIAETVRFGPGS
ncbi:MAG TPA: hypothetical protein VGM90_24825 [Kofleriaceae bacterium]|jgi:hypothetical protein